MNNSAEIRNSDPVGAETLDHISEADEFNKWMYSAISPYLKGDILEVGSGIGNISAFLLSEKTYITLSDLRDDYCSYLKEHFRSHKSLSGVEKIDLAEKDFKNRYNNLLNKFDTVFALNVIEHIENDNDAVLNCKNLLKDTGTLVLLVPSYESLYCRFDKELGHFRRYNRKTLSELIERNGFKIKKLFNFNAAGISAWFFFGKLLNNKQIKEGQMKLYNNFVFIFKLIDKMLFHKIGLSLIIIAEK